MLKHPPRLHFGAFEVDIKAGEVWKHGRRIRLQEQPYRVLLTLLEVPGETVTRQELRERLWPAETFVDFDNGLNNIINRLRGALGDSASSPRLIETVGRRGYRFIGEVANPEALSEIHLGQPAPEPSAGGPAAAPDSGHDQVPAGDQAAVDITTDQPPVAVGSQAALTPAHAPSTRRWTVLGAAAAVVILTVGTVALVGPARLSSLFGATAISASPGIRSLGVLPLADPTDPPGDLFAYGMVNAVVTELSRFQSLRIVSPMSVAAYREQPARSPRELARELGVDTVLRGSVTRNAEHIGVRLELIDGASGRPVWDRTFTRPVSERLSLRSDIVRDVIQQVQALMVPAALTPQPEPVTANVRAYEAYLRGQFETLRRNPRAFTRAVAHFTHALALDPDYASAHAGLAWARLQQSGWAGEDHPRQHADDVRLAIDRALALDSNLAEAHVALALASRLYSWDWAGAEAAVKRAIQLKPSSAMAHNEYTRVLLCLGRFSEALAEAQKTLALDPFAPIYWLNEGVVLYNLRRFDEAEARYRRALELEPTFSSAHRRLVRLYLAQGRVPEARVALRALEALPNRTSVRALQAQVEAAAGNAAAARRLLAGLDANARRREAATAAASHLALGDRAAALAALRTGVDERSVQPLAFAAPELDALRADPAFVELLAVMRVPTGSIGAHVAVTSQHVAPETVASR